MKKGWQDATAYSRDERRGETAARTFQRKLGQVTMTVTRHISLEKHQWKVYVEGIFSTVVEGDAGAAQELCETYLRQHLQNLIKAIG